jgi:hypothetical protein
MANTRRGPDWWVQGADPDGDRLDLQDRPNDRVRHDYDEFGRVTQNTSPGVPAVRVRWRTLRRRDEARQIRSAGL